MNPGRWVYRMHGSVRGAPTRALGWQVANTEDEALRLFDQIINDRAMSFRHGIIPVTEAVRVEWADYLEQIRHNRGKPDPAAGRGDE